MLLADSPAIQGRLFSHYQAAVMLVTIMLQNPNQETFRWLDLGCGKGQIVRQLALNIEEKAFRNKIEYTGYDSNSAYIDDARNFFKEMGLEPHFFHDELSRFSDIVPVENLFHFITCTNTVHEIGPKTFARIIIDSLVRLSESGILFIHDMESLEPPELGAFPWCGHEIDQLLNVVFEVIGTKYKVCSNRWQHPKCKAWTVVIQRQHINISRDALISKQNEINHNLDKKIKELLHIRLNDTIVKLKCLKSTSTEDDKYKIIKDKLLHDLYAIFVSLCEFFDSIGGVVSGGYEVLIANLVRGNSISIDIRQGEGFVEFELFCQEDVEIMIYMPPQGNNTQNYKLFIWNAVGLENPIIENVIDSYDMKRAMDGGLTVTTKKIKSGKYFVAVLEGR